jgi:pimeloyl-ACP methyl ester carboxylesterase
MSRSHSIVRPACNHVNNGNGKFMMPEVEARTDSVAVDDGTKIHFRVAGNEGPTIVFIHGYPETSIAWRHLVGPATRAGFRVVMPDLRGAGGSSRPFGGYDKWTLAGDVLAVLDVLEINDCVNVVGHDIGAMVAYAFVRRFPVRSASLAFLDAPLPGTTLFERVSQFGQRTWHFHFHQARDIAEALTAGREAYYLDRFWHDYANRPDAIDMDTFAEYVRAFSQPGAMRSGFELYRSFNKDVADNQAALQGQGKLGLPVLAIAGAAGPYAGVLGDMLREVAINVEETNIPASGHWIAEENPDALWEVLQSFLRSS